MAMKKEALTNLIADDLAKRNDNWEEIDTTFALKADKSTTYTKTEVDTSLGLKANKQQEVWITPTLLNGYTPMDEYRRPRYRKNDLGQLVMTGGFTSANNNLPIFILPSGYKPDRQVNIAVFDIAAAAKRINIDPTSGVVKMITSATGQFYLENITIELDGI